MATLAKLTTNFKDTGYSVQVPDNPYAKLMYYLRSVTHNVNIDFLPDDLLDYKNYGSLSRMRKILLLRTALELPPNIFIDKLIFKDDEREIIPATASNTFIKITTACDIVSVQPTFILGGQAQSVSKVMFYTTSWLTRMYYTPLRSFSPSKHCQHCPGSASCRCARCPVGSSKRCEARFMELLYSVLRDEATVNPTPTSSSPAHRSRTPSLPHALPLPPSSPPTPSRRVLSKDQHRVYCDGCKEKYFTRSRFKCMVCANYDLCTPCYRSNTHHFSSGHHFAEYTRPDEAPVFLPVRKSTGTLSKSNSRAPTVGGDEKQDLFCNSMSTAELKAYLRMYNVHTGDISDKRALRKRVWETHVDCMPLSELNAFLSSSNISTAGCRDVKERRDRAKAAFDSPRVMRTSTAASRSWKKDDVVVLRGLKTATMNGKKGVVQSVDEEAQKLTISVGGDGKSFKVKFDNVMRWLDDDIEELV